MASTSVLEISDVDAFDKTKKSLPSDSLLVLYFHAPWATPCIQMSEVIKTLASTYPASNPPKVSFFSIDAEELPDISEDHDVTAVPFVVVQRPVGTTLATISGLHPSDVRAAVEKQYNAAYPSENGNDNRLPPAQKVTPPANQPTPQINSQSSAPPTNGTPASGETKSAKDLSSYAPKASDPQTAPAYSSSGMPQDPEAPSQSKEELTQRLDELTKAAPCMLFMKGTPSAPQCGFSRQLVSILREQGVRYGFFNILADEEVRQGLKEYADWPTFPQLWLGGELVGGLDIVKEELSADPQFFGEYVANPAKTPLGGGGPASADQQKAPTAAA